MIWKPQEITYMSSNPPKHILNVAIVVRSEK
jgi:hypothetical protein